MVIIPLSARRKSRCRSYRLNTARHPEKCDPSDMQASDLAINIKGMNLRENSKTAQTMQQLAHQAERDITAGHNGAEQGIHLSLVQP